MTYTHVPNITRSSVTATEEKAEIINSEMHSGELKKQLDVIGPDEIFTLKHSA
jgi:hypothetical protein